jgi:uncharacterized LabA/DUF88 family protein
MNQTKDLKFAVLIDADNVPYSNIKGILEEIAKYGTPTFKRIYADWTKPTVSGWKGVLLENAINPVQQYSYTTGKNATDSAMIIDAMDILYTGKVDGFCIISSDSDFTKLATRLRESSMVVFGVGERKTPAPFIAACDKFIYVEIIAKDEKPDKESILVDKKTSKPTKNTKKKEAPISNINRDILKLITESINDIADENGWAFLGDLGNFLIKRKPDFDARNYGYPKLFALVKGLNKFDFEERDASKGNSKQIYVKNRNK